jgi:hypothetical protein
MTGMDWEKVLFSILGRKGECELVGFLFQNQNFEK